MAQTKYVTIGCNGRSIGELKAVTEVKISEEIDSDLVKTFDDPVPVPSSDGGYTVDISLLATRTVDEFITLKKIIKDMKTIEGTIQVRETHKRSDVDVVEVNDFTGCLLASNEATYSAEDLTARELSFSAKKVTEKINGETI